jgi:polyisoprenoid-binding protein YceI
MTNPFRSLRIPGLALLLVLPVAAQSVDTYQIDPVHSTVGFKIRHLVTKVTGRFTSLQGKVLYDTQDVTRSSVDVSIDSKSVDTGVEARDKHLRTADFFDVDKYPTLTFKSTSVKVVSKGSLEVTGTFTMHGVSRTLTIPVTNLGTTQGMKPGSVVAGFEGSVTFKRSDFGMGKMIGLLGDEVEVTLEIEADKVQ